MPKPLAPYMRFCKEQRAAVVKANPKMAFAEVGKELGKQWKALNDKARAKYVAPYEKEMASWRKDHPESPKVAKKAEKKAEKKGRK
jgi:hypothetical protein